MQLKFKKSYKFALKSSLYVTLFFLATIFLYHYFVQQLDLLIGKMLYLVLKTLNNSIM